MIPSPVDFKNSASQNGYDKDKIDFFLAVIQDHPDFRFKVGKKFAFRPPRTIIVGPSEPFSELLFLHEVSHALCKHESFKMDVDRLKMENEAWDKARELAKKYGLTMDEEIIQEELDTYRDWLHQKSRCPRCDLTRYQTPDGLYHCPRCEMLKQKRS